jgi:hypothetical protein
MQPLIEAVDRNLLMQELTKEKFVRHTNFAQNEIYILTAHNSPNVMLEIARLRELSFRQAGGGTGLEIDIDEFDTMEVPYSQLVVWSPEEKEIIGGYRFIHLKDAKKDENGHFHLATSHMFNFSQRFVDDFFPYTIELGRSFVQPQYQPTKDSRKGIFSLDNLWDGLGALMVDNHDLKYFFGKVTLYLSYNQQARDVIMWFLNRFFPDNEKLVVPFDPKGYSTDISIFEHMFDGKTYEENHRILVKYVRTLNSTIPPLVNAYMNLSPSMRNFGAAFNELFGDVEEIGILVHLPDIYPSKKNRHINSYIKERNDY